MSETALLPAIVGPVTSAVRRFLLQARGQAMLSDLLFLESWELAPTPGAAAALRVSQIRRANPELAAAVRTEIAGAARLRSGRA